jgi:hypothetical protein
MEMKMSEQKTYTGEALYAMNSNHMLKSILNLINLIDNQCARSKPYSIPVRL